ncbi:MAG: hypothetical protein ACNI26_12815 [Terasakiella sp.]|uniref:hypothetical protein n=1 Tax=unclassified Terasakiella TaxID=2614952 RepID=UPI003B004C2E
MGKSVRQVSFHRALYTGVSVGVWVLLTSPCFAQNTFDPFAPDVVAPTEPNATPKAPEPTAPKIVRAPVEPEQPVAKKAPEKPAVNASEIAPPAPSVTVPEAKPVIQTPPPVEEQVQTPVAEQTPAAIKPQADPAPVFNVAPNPQTTDPFAPSYVISTQPQPTPAAPLAAAPTAQETTATATAATTPQAQPSAPMQTTTTATPSTPVADKNNPSFLERLGNLFTSSEQSPAQETQNEEPAPPAVSEPISPTLKAPPVIEKEEAAQPAVADSKETKQSSFFDKLRNFLTPAQTSEDPKLPQADTAQKVIEEEPKLEPKPVPTPEPEPIQETIPEQEAISPPVVTPTAPSPSAPEEEEPGLLNKIGNFFGSPFSSDEKAAQDTKIQEQSPTPATTSPTPAPTPDTPPSPPKPIDPRLVKAEFGLGSDIKLGQGDNDLSKQAKCFTKNRGTIAFCTTPTRWPDAIARHFEISTHLYKGTRGIVQYEGNIATRLYGLFKGDGFQNVVKYYENEYGPATNSFVRDTRLLSKTVKNKSYIWRKENPQEGLVEIMEIRQIADTRGPTPDLDSSMIRLYFEGSREIFSQVSDLDFMHLR